MTELTRRALLGAGIAGAAAVAATLTGCTVPGREPGAASSSDPVADLTTTPSTTSESKVLLVFFSRPDSWSLGTWNRWKALSRRMVQ